MRRRHCSQGARAGGWAGWVQAMLGTYCCVRKHSIVFHSGSGARGWGRGKGQTAGSKAKCGGGCGMWSASPRDAGFGGTQGSALLPQHSSCGWMVPREISHLSGALRTCWHPSLQLQLTSIQCLLSAKCSFTQCLKPHISGRRGVPPACCPLYLALFLWISKSVLFQELSWSCGLWTNWWLLVNFLVIVHLEFPSGEWGGVGLLCLPHLQGYKQNTSLMLKAKCFRHESERWLHYLLAV